MLVKRRFTVGSLSPSVETPSLPAAVTPHLILARIRHLQDQIASASSVEEVEPLREELRTELRSLRRHPSVVALIAQRRQGSVPTTRAHEQGDWQVIEETQPVPVGAASDR